MSTVLYCPESKKELSELGANGLIGKTEVLKRLFTVNFSDSW
jgi:hypothetical protein